MAKVKQKSLLTFISQTKFGRNALALYRCECGNIKEIRIRNVKQGSASSCGCLKKRLDLVHGLYRHPLYRIWTGIKQRCYYHKAISFPKYGGKGVKMCEEWVNDPEKFIKWALSNGWKKGMNIDKDIKAELAGLVPDLYSPERCSIVTPKINSNHRSNTNFIEYGGRKLSLQEWADEKGIFCETLRHRIKIRGWSIEKALTTPVKGH